MPEITVLIAENDSHWIQWARDCSTPEHALVLMVQLADEAERSFFDRVKRRFEYFAREGKLIKRVVLVPGSRWSARSLLARAVLVRKVLSQLVQRSDTQLVLDGGPKGGPAALGMRAIAEAICDSTASALSQLRLVSGAAALTPQAA